MRERDCMDRQLKGTREASQNLISGPLDQFACLQVEAGVGNLQFVNPLAQSASLQVKGVPNHNFVKPSRSTH